MLLGGQGRPYARGMSRGMLAPNPSGQAIQHEGIEVHQIARDGLTKRIAPSLNFLEVDRLLPNGERTVHTSIKVGSTMAAATTVGAPKRGPVRDPLFEPPYGATIQWRNNPAGIVTGQRGDVIPKPKGR